jgi:hypothetical protein
LESKLKFWGQTRRQEKEISKKTKPEEPTVGRRGKVDVMKEMPGQFREVPGGSPAGISYLVSSLLEMRIFFKHKLLLGYSTCLWGI